MISAIGERCSVKRNRSVSLSLNGEKETVKRVFYFRFTRLSIRCTVKVNTYIYFKYIGITITVHQRCRARIVLATLISN